MEYFVRNVQLAHIRMYLDLVECFVIRALLRIFLVVLLILLFEVALLKLHVLTNVFRRDFTCHIVIQP
ncbi:hypothetical protein NC652_017703 [Populus alba x Populus x berolinensis]|nr:hypothetical protein NC652_017703 [Populus alba x Populus x berolinensis]